MGKNQLRNAKGHFISLEKSEAIKFVAEQNGAKDAQQYLDQNYSDLEAYIERTEFETRFNEKNYMQQIDKYNKVYINGERVSKKEAMYQVSKVVNYMKGTQGMTNIVFNGTAKDQSIKSKKNVRIDFKLPVIKRGAGAFDLNLMELEQMLDDEDIIYYLG
jgi:hypothetical protein